MKTIFSINKPMTYQFHNCYRDKPRQTMLHSQHPVIIGEENKLYKLGYIKGEDNIFNLSNDSLHLVEEILDELGKLNKKGFVNCLSLSEVSDYSILSKYADLLLKEVEEGGGGGKMSDLSIDEMIDLGK